MNSRINNSSRTKHSLLTHSYDAGRRTADIPSVYDAATRLSPSTASRFGGSQSAAAEDFFSQFWTPGLLDRLQSPLTRYRE
jgi:hypothetical protein